MIKCYLLISFFLLLFLLCQSVLDACHVASQLLLVVNFLVPPVYIKERTTESVVYLERSYGYFALMFCKRLSILNKTDAISKFESSVNTIARGSLKSKDADKDLIKWARDFNKAKVTSVSLPLTWIYCHHFNHFLV